MKTIKQQLIDLIETLTENQALFALTFLKRILGKD